MRCIKTEAIFQSLEELDEKKDSEKLKTFGVSEKIRNTDFLTNLSDHFKLFQFCSNV